jgi:hypothetical protein
MISTQMCCWREGTSCLLLLLLPLLRQYVYGAG